jgi:two-component sensor histidine kinase
VRRDGSTLRAELRFMAMDWNGPGRLAVLARDVTRAHEREQELEQERDVLQSQVRTHTQELTELQRMEDELKRSLSEKETLLKEIHHRVKNNLQIVSSLLTLQMEQMTTREARAMLTESVHRVRSMALVHQHLYGSTSLERVDLGAYAQHLTETLRYVLAPHARVEVDASSVEATSEHAIPLGLVLNELLTNAFKYGCPTREAGEVRPPDAWDVRVELTEAQRRLRLVVTDRGPGLPTGFDPQRTSSLGLQLVRSLTRQLKGRFTARSEGGAVFEFTCPL